MNGTEDQVSEFMNREKFLVFWGWRRVARREHGERVVSHIRNSWWVVALSGIEGAEVALGIEGAEFALGIERLWAIGII